MIVEIIILLILIVMYLNLSIRIDKLEK